MSAQEEKLDGMNWLTLVMLIAFIAIPIVGISQCSGAMGPTQQQICEEKGGVWERQLADCMNPDVYMK